MYDLPPLRPYDLFNVSFMLDLCRGLLRIRSFLFHYAPTHLQAAHCRRHARPAPPPSELHRALMFHSYAALLPGRRRLAGLQACSHLPVTLLNLLHPIFALPKLHQRKIAPPPTIGATRVARHL